MGSSPQRTVHSTLSSTTAPISRLSLGLGGTGAPLVGLLADWGGLETAMLVVAALTVPGLVLALPREARDPRQHAAQAPRRRRATATKPGIEDVAPNLVAYPVTHRRDERAAREPRVEKQERYGLAAADE